MSLVLLLIGSFSALRYFEILLLCNRSGNGMHVYVLFNLLLFDHFLCGLKCQNIVITSERLMEIKCVLHPELFDILNDGLLTAGTVCDEPQ